MLCVILSLSSACQLVTAVVILATEADSDDSSFHVLSSPALWSSVEETGFPGDLDRCT